MQWMPRAVRLCTAWLMLVYWVALDVSPAVADLAPSRVSGVTSIASTRDADLVVIRHALEHRMVAQKLRDYGVAPAEVEARLASMPDRDVHTLAATAKGLPSGGDGLDALVTVLIIVLLVIVILKLMHKDIVIK